MGKNATNIPGTACRVTVSVRLGSIITRRKVHMTKNLTSLFDALRHIIFLVSCLTIWSQYLLITYVKSTLAKPRKYRGMFEVNSPEKNYDKFREKDWSQQVLHMQVPNGTGPRVRRSKCPLSVCFTRRKCSMATSRKSVKGRVRYEV